MPRAHGPAASAQFQSHAERVRAYAARVEAGLPLFEDGPVEVAPPKSPKRPRRVRTVTARPAADAAAPPVDPPPPACDKAAPPP